MEYCLFESDEMEVVLSLGLELLGEKGVLGFVSSGDLLDEVVHLHLSLVLYQL